MLNRVYYICSKINLRVKVTTNVATFTSHVIKQPELIKSSDLTDWGDVKQPIPGSMISKLRGKDIVSYPSSQIDVGIWECSPGKWRRQVVLAEFCHFLSGKCRFIFDSGEVLDLKGGDSVFFQENSHGIWEVDETVRKTYIIFKPKLNCDPS
jgi:uncharacterized cupin superfamily protein